MTHGQDAYTPSAWMPDALNRITEQKALIASLPIGSPERKRTTNHLDIMQDNLRAVPQSKTLLAQARERLHRETIIDRVRPEQEQVTELRQTLMALVFPVSAFASLRLDPPSRQPAPEPVV